MCEIGFVGQMVPKACACCGGGKDVHEEERFVESVAKGGWGVKEEKTEGYSCLETLLDMF
jgi:hypothetical protein